MLIIKEGWNEGPIDINKLFVDTEYGYFTTYDYLYTEWQYAYEDGETDCKTIEEYIRECTSKNGTLERVKKVVNLHDYGLPYDEYYAYCTTKGKWYLKTGFHARYICNGDLDEDTVMEFWYERDFFDLPFGAYDNPELMGLGSDFDNAALENRKIRKVESCLNRRENMRRLKEGLFDTKPKKWYYGLEGAEKISHGSYSDAEILWDGILLSEPDVIDGLWYEYQELQEEPDFEYDDFDEWVYDNLDSLESALDDCAWDTSEGIKYEMKEKGFTWNREESTDDEQVFEHESGIIVYGQWKDIQEAMTSKFGAVLTVYNPQTEEFEVETYRL